MLSPVLHQGHQSNPPHRTPQHGPRDCPRCALVTDANPVFFLFDAEGVTRVLKTRYIAVALKRSRTFGSKPLHLPCLEFQWHCTPELHLRPCARRSLSLLGLSLASWAGHLLPTPSTSPVVVVPSPRTLYSPLRPVVVLVACELLVNCTTLMLRVVTGNCNGDLMLNAHSRALWFVKEQTLSFCLRSVICLGT
jgi:hypothetical protein